MRSFLRRFFGSLDKPVARRTQSTSLRLETLEDRTVPYSVTGNAWVHPEVVSVGFVADGTIVGANAQGAIASNLHSALNARYGSNAWQQEILKAVQAWAQQTNINFTVITDNGGQIGSGLFQQGDPNMADIRIGGYDFGTNTLGLAYMPPPDNTFSVAGDLQLNTGTLGALGTTRDLFTVASHELGHALGLGHSGITTATMFASYNGVKSTLRADDIAGIRAIYGGARVADSYDAAASNGTFASASNLTSLINTTTKQALATGLDLTTTTDVDFYKFTAPSEAVGTMTLKMQTSGLSLLSGKVTVYASNQTTVLGTATAQGDYDGSTLTVSVPNIASGATYYVKVEGAETGTGNLQAFNTGTYSLAVGFASVSAPVLFLPNTMILVPLDPRGGGGIAAQPPPQMLVAGDEDLLADAVRHSYGPDGCECDHDHAAEDHAQHEHTEEDDHGCGCGTCSVAVAEVQPVAAVVRQVSGTEGLGQALRSLTSDDHGSSVTTEQHSEQETPEAVLHDAPIAPQTLRFTVSSPSTKDSEGSDSFCIGSPAFGDCQWLSPLMS